MRVLLVRHGRPAHERPWRPVDRLGVERWRAGYDAAGLAERERPPAPLVSEVARADVIAASSLPRAVDSARRLAPERAVEISPLFREVPLPIPASSLRAPLVLWEMLVHLRWGLDILRGDDEPAAERERVREAADWCAERCRRHGPEATLVVVTHGVVRRLLARRLAGDGWRPEMGRQGWAPWSVWRMRAE